MAFLLRIHLNIFEKKKKVSYLDMADLLNSELNIDAIGNYVPTEFLNLN